MELCDHPDKGTIQNKAIFNRDVKILHKITVKMTIYIKATGNDICHNTFGFYLQMVMRELNKHKLKGYEKRELTQTIMILLLDSLGLPHIVSYYTAEIILDMIEIVYQSKMHKFRKVHKCAIM